MYRKIPFSTWIYYQKNADTERYRAELINSAWLLVHKQLDYPTNPQTTVPDPDPYVLGLPDLHPDPLATSTDPDPSLFS
jgi:hypothetical protein